MNSHRSLSGNYESLLVLARDNPEAFWGQASERITWFKPWTKLKEVSFHKPVSIRWYLGGELNACYNCVDRHLPHKKDQVALIFEEDSSQAVSRKITYQELYEKVVEVALVLRKMGVQKGDRVTLYMPMVPEAIFSILACARLGAIHSVVFGGFAPDSLADRIMDADSEWVITATQGRRGGKQIPLKSNVDRAIEKLKEKQKNSVKKVLVFDSGTGSEWEIFKDRDCIFSEARREVFDQIPAGVPPEPMSSEDPLFMLYTSGSTNKPKGVLHTTGGYLVYANQTFDWVFDYREGEVFWCTADVGWITGHSYIVYGPLSRGATQVIFEGVPTHPNPGRFWEIVEKYQVNVFYTAPTALRSLMREGDEWVQKHNRKSLRLLGSVGEPINPEAWNWYHRVVGEGRCDIVDTWWQTETGGILISPLPGITALKAGSATRPLPGIKPELLTPEGRVIEGSGEGVLVLKDSWPGQMRTVYKDHDRFEATYFSTYPGYYFTGDGCRRDADGNYWITGRVDDVLNVAGHRLGTAEIESALVAHGDVAEAAVVGFPHEIKGQGIYVFVTLKKGVDATELLKRELIDFVRGEISPIATPDLLQWAPALPKTRSGKIMRRILRKIAENQTDSLGDISTLADPSVVEELVKNRLSLK